ncbi:MAG: efflux RND transporter periplasmic adaptor subunit [Chromatiales bacterium]|jgi:HlyD family secretion protein|nr:efflux RND transporter periplasmic adaptor subunit [Chromatiales bacterium]
MKKISIILAITLLVTACGKPPEVASKYGTATVEQRNIIVTVEAAGVIEPETTVEVKSKASGEILNLAVDSGTQIEAGVLMVQIDKRSPRNMLNQAEAELEAAIARRDIAKSQQDRAETLHASGTLNKVDLEKSILEYANARAEVVRSQVSVENARIALDDTEVRAPITGTVIEKNVEKGQVISSPTTDVGGGTVLLKMADLSSVQVRALIDETDIGKIMAGQDAIVTVAAYPNQPFNGQVLKIEPKAEEDQAVTMFSALVNIDNQEGLLRPGMNAEVNLRIASRMDIPAVPTMALRTMRDISASETYLGLEEGWIREQLRQSETTDTASNSGQSGYRFGNRYWLLLETEQGLQPVYAVTGITDLDYSEIISGVSQGDEIVMLPSAGLIKSQERFRDIMGGMSGVPGMKGKDGDKK